MPGTVLTVPDIALTVGPERSPDRTLAAPQALGDLSHSPPALLEPPHLAHVHIDSRPADGSATPTGGRVGPSR